MNLLNALWNHIWLLMTWRHDGRGLPEQTGGLVLFALLYYFGKFISYPGLESAAAGVLAILLIVGTPLLMVLLMGRQLACGLLLVNTLTSVSSEVVGRWALPFDSTLQLGIRLWAISTSILLIVRTIQRRKTTKERAL